jgi:LEA14-like dessication related protein
MGALYTFVHTIINMKNLLLVLSVIASSLIMASCASTKGLKYQDVTDLTIKRYAKDPFTVYIKFYNPNKFPLDIRYANIETFLEDLPLGEVKFDTLVKVHGHEEFNYALRYRPDYDKMFPNADMELANPNLNVKINGTMAVEHKRKFYITAIHYQGDMPQNH